MSIQSNFPAIKPTLLLDFANVEQLDPRITFTRASTATYYGTQTAKAEENLLLQSQDFTTTWTVAGTNATVTANTTAAPDGTTTADTLTDDATSGVHRVAQSLTTSNTNQLVYSVFAKYSTLQWFTLALSTSTGTWAGAKFDVQNGVLGSISQQGTGFTANSSSITSVGNGWYRCVLVLTPGASGSTVVTISGATDGTTFTISQRGSEVYTGTGSSVFIWGAQLEQRSAVTAYTLTTTQTITNYIPQLLTAASGVPRFDYNPTTFESLGLLIEEQRTNLETYSSDFSDAVWVKTDTTIGSNVIIAPDGTLTGDKLIASATTTTHTLTVPSRVYTFGTAYSMSIYAKVGELNTFDFVRGGPGGYSAGFNLATQTATDFVGGGTVSITSVGNGWFRCSMSWTSTSSSARTHLIRLNNPDGTYTFLGDGFSGMYFWGIQTEAGAFPTSYIPTVASQVTRSNDVASMTGTNFSSWYNAAQGTLYAEFNPLALAASNGVVINDNTTSNRIRLATTSVSDQGTVTTSGTAQAVLDGGTPVANTSMKLAMTYQVNNFALSLNGAAAATDTAGTVPVVSQLQFGAETTTVGNLTIKKMAYYPIVSTAAQLQALTS
jgi:hypothetical protein